MINIFFLIFINKANHSYFWMDYIYCMFLYILYVINNKYVGVNKGWSRESWRIKEGSDSNFLKC